MEENLREKENTRENIQESLQKESHLKESHLKESHKMFRLSF
jgi:hypothetical protein